MRRPIKDPQGFALGVLFLLIAGLAIALGYGYRQGTATEMGPGYFPRLAGWGLGVVGALVTIGSLHRPGPSVEWRSAVRPLALLTVSIALFAMLLRPLGLILAVVLLMILSSAASPESRRAETLGGAIMVAALCALIFVKGLGMTIPLWPAFPL